MLLLVKKMSNFVTNTEHWRILYPPEKQLSEIVLLNAGFVPQLSSWNTHNCIQNFWVLWYNFSPGCACISGGEIHELTPDKIILIPPNTLYSGQLGQMPPHFFIWFKTGTPFYYPERKVLEIPAKPFLPQLRQAVGKNERTTVCHFNLISSILLSIPETAFTPPQYPSKSRTIEKALSFIAQNRGNVTNTQIAAELHLSPIRFSHLFKEEMGISPQRYCLQIKMAQAEQFLLLGWSIENTAKSCNFADRYHFSKEFKKYHGISPGRWVKQYSKSQIPNK